MIYVEDFYNKLELIGDNVERKVYLATDDPKVWEECINNYPNYTFIGNYNATFTAKNKRYSTNDKTLRLANQTLTYGQNGLGKFTSINLFYINKKNEGFLGVIQQYDSFFIFEQIFGWVYVGLSREDLWMSSTTDAHVVG